MGGENPNDFPRFEDAVNFEAPTDRLFFGTIRKTTKDHSQQSLQISTIQMD